MENLLTPFTTLLLNPIFFFLFTLLLLLLLLLKQIIITSSSSSSTNKPLPIPPGPKPWPIVGNIPHIATQQQPHQALMLFANLHGPLVSLKLGTQLLVVASSPTAAAEVLKTHDRFFSGRLLSKANPYGSRPADMDRMGIVAATSCTRDWISSRNLCRTRLFSTKAIEVQASVRERKVAEMVEFLRSHEGRGVDVGDVVFATVFNSMCKVLLSRDFVIGFDGKDVAEGLKRCLRRIMELGATPNLADFYPAIAWLDLQGLRRKTQESMNEMFGLWENYVRERRESHVHDNGAVKDFLDVFLENGFDDEKINWLLLELFSASTDTTTTVIEWAMAEVLKNREVLNKLRRELQTQINTTNSIVKESQLSQLPYLNACVKETLRLHPPLPLLIPHRALQTCEIMNHTIPINARICVNVWGIGRDPSVWEDPLSFKPERFLGSDMDFKGHDFELLPFSSGRRMCPGLPMASKQIQLILANLVHYFEWCLPNGEEGFAEMDMKEKMKIMLKKEQPLILVPKHKL